MPVRLSRFRLGRYWLMPSASSSQVASEAAGGPHGPMDTCGRCTLTELTDRRWRGDTAIRYTIIGPARRP